MALGGLVLTGLVSSGLLGVFPPAIRFIAVFSALTFLPGEVLLRWVFRYKPGSLPFRIPLGFLLGLSSASLVTWFATVFGLSFDRYAALLQFYLGAVFLGGWVAGMYASRKSGEKSREPRRQMDAASAIYLGAALAVAGFFYFSPPVLNAGGDAYDHIGYLRTVAFENKLEPAGVLAPPAEPQTKKAAGDPRKGAAHPLMAAAALFASIDPARLWILLPVLLAPVALLAFSDFAERLLPSKGLTAFAVVLFLMFQGGIGRQFLSTTGYGQNLALVFYWALFGLCLVYARTPRKGLFSAVLVLVAGGTAIHLDVAIHFAFLLASFVVFFRVFGFAPRSIAALAAGSGGVLLGLLVWKLTTSVTGANEIHTHPQGLLYLSDMGGPLYVVSPVELLKKNGLLFIVGICFVPALLVLKNHRRHARMNLALSVVPIVIALNPWIAPIVYREGAYLLHRVLLNVPALPINALVLGGLVKWARRKGPAKKAAAVILLFFWAKILWVGVLSWAADMKSIRFQGTRILDAGGLGDVVDFLEQRVRTGSVVLSDPTTAYTLSAFADVKVVAVLDQHGSPNDDLAFDRLNAVRRVLSPFTTQGEAVAAVGHFGIDYVIVNGRAGDPLRGFFWSWNPRHAAVAEEKLGNLRSVFKRVYDVGGVSIYRVIGMSPVGYTWYPTVPYIERRASDTEACELRLGTLPVRVRAVSVHPSEALPGTDVTVSITYWKDDDYPPSMPLKLYLRLDEANYFASARKYPGDKIVRRFLERWRGGFLRFRFDHTPFDGIYPPEMWPSGTEVYEDWTIRLPSNLRDSLYELRLKLDEDTLIPNFAVRDFFYNEDSYTGKQCSTIRVTRFLTR